MQKNIDGQSGWKIVLLDKKQGMERFWSRVPVNPKRTLRDKRAK